MRFYSHLAGTIESAARTSTVTQQEKLGAMRALLQSLGRFQQIFVIGKRIDIGSFSIACDIIEYLIKITEVPKKVLNINNETVLNNYLITSLFNTKGL